MSIIEEYKKIPKDVSSSDDLDFQFLKSTGMAYIEEMGGGLWTDLNAHDPGITFLELLSYAITDLALRIESPLADIVANKQDPLLRNQFYRAEEILPTAPHSAGDYRKTFIDIPGVRNAWIRPFEQSLYVDCHSDQLAYTPFSEEIEQRVVHLKGLNKVLVDLEPDAEFDAIEKEIRKRYEKNRNLCEELVEVREVGKYAVGLCATISLERNADENLVHAEILDQVDQYMSVTIPRYTLQQLLEKGYRTEDIFDGPFLENGFILDDDLRIGELRSEVRLSDIINIIMDIEGVELIEDITIQDCGDQSKQKDWLICIDPDHKPFLAPTAEIEPGTTPCDLRSVFNYKKDVIPLFYDSDQVQDNLTHLQNLREISNIVGRIDMTYDFPQGKDLEINRTTTILNDLPETYGVGPYGLTGGADEDRKAQAMQLKGYLSFFDQVLASYFAHLDKVKELLSFDAGAGPTYFTQAIQDIQGFEKLVKNYPLDDNAALTAELMGDLDDNFVRRNQFLDHLLARFAENFSDYAFLMRELYDSMAEQKIIETKEAFLQNYVESSATRASGYDITGPDVWTSNNVSGLQKRVSLLTGISDYSRRSLWQNFVEWSEDPSGSGNWNWKIKNQTGEAVLSSLSDFSSEEAVVSELCSVLHRILSITTTAIEQTDPNELNSGDLLGSVRIEFSEGSDGDKSNFIGFLVDPDVPDSDEQKQALFSGTHDVWMEWKTFALDTISFLQNQAIEEGFFLIEHILLRPNSESPSQEEWLPICTDECRSDCALDPYSFRVSIIFPGFGERFSNPDFRHFMENLIQAELPAHIMARICWVGMRDEEREECELPLFERYYEAFLETKKEINEGTGSDQPEVREQLIAKLSSLHTIYPTGRLFDCDNPSAGNSILLGRSNLGTTK